MSSFSATPRLTRSRVAALAHTVPCVPADKVQPSSEASTLPGTGQNNPKESAIVQLPQGLTRGHTGLRQSDHVLLVKKQAWLAQNAVSIPQAGFVRHKAAVEAALVFGQEEAGTAVCIADEGLLLTCSHCCADEAGNRPGKSKLHWLIFSSGRVVGAKCIAWDAKRDLALLRITKAQRHSYKGVSQSADYQFPSVKVATEHIAVGSRMMCIGHPGSEDLEAEEAGIETGYDVLHASAGRFRGHAEGQDVQDNSEIGALMHDCWTYWGHSGAPLLAWATGQLVGLHSSWDDQTAMRRGVALEATREFLKEHGFAHLI
ncbi:AT hook motif family protein [Apiospora arundinis]